MKKAKNVVTRGLLVMAFTLAAVIAMDAAGMVPDGTREAQAAIKIPKNAKKAEKKAAKKINNSGANIESAKWKKGRLVKLEGENVKLTHLKAFTGLKELNMTISDSTWKKADFSKYKKLERLVLSELQQSKNYLKQINLSKNKKLTSVRILGWGDKKGTVTKLQKLSWPKNGKLQSVFLYQLSFNKLDLSKCRNLQSLTLKMISINELNVSGLDKLKNIMLPATTKLSKLSLEGLSGLERLTLTRCDDLKECHVSNCSKLNYLAVNGKNLTAIHVKNCPLLPPHRAASITESGITPSAAIRSDGSRGYPVLSYDGKLYDYVEEGSGNNGDWKCRD